MKVLWITNLLFPVPSEALGLSAPIYGGWMVSSLNALKEIVVDIKFAIATVYYGDKLQVIERDDVLYYLLPSRVNMTRYDKSLEQLWRLIRDTFEPDVVHIHGTEYAPGLAYIRACGSSNVCISIQGLISVISRYYCAGLTCPDIVKNLTFRDIVKFDTIFQQKRRFDRRGILEKEYIKSVSHIIGRTSWDQAHVWAINDRANYHFCNETLRPSFYKHKWEYNKCDKHTIFLSQASYPIKGFHMVLKAMPMILKHFPNTRVRVAGHDIIHKPLYRISGYGMYLKSLIKKYHLEDKVTFLGNLSEDEICSEYLKANLFICPSAIENSPNSLCEAQILELPYLASYVGGIPDLMNGNEQFLYRYDDVEMLAEKVCKIFSHEECKSLYVNYALERHNLSNCAESLLRIYQSI